MKRVFSLLFTFFSVSSLFAQIGMGTITPDASSVLDISATDKGILIPRVSLSAITDTQLDGSNTAATGLLIFNTNNATTGGDGAGYYYFNGTIWERLITSAIDTDWTIVGGNIERQSGDVYIGDTSGTNNDIFISNRLIDWDNTTYYIDPGAENVMNEIQFDSGTAVDASIRFTEQNTGFFSPFTNRFGFSVAGTQKFQWLNNVNGVFRMDFLNNNDNVLIGENTGLALNSSVIDNVGIGNRVMQVNISGIGNVGVGERVLAAVTSSYNTGIGAVALGSLTTGQENVAVGASALFHNNIGSFNTSVGRSSGFNVIGGDNVFLGYRAGYSGSSRSISGSVFIGNEAGLGVTDSHRLYLDNSSTSTPLLYGEFDNDLLRINGRLQIGTPATMGYAFPISDGLANQLLETDGAGNLNWVTSSAIVTANNGLTNSGTTVQLGGLLNQTTTVSASMFDFNINLNSTGDFYVQDAGINVFEVDSGGISNFGDDTYWRDGNTAGTIIASITDDVDDGVFRLYENGLTSVLLDANSNFVFNEQGLDRDFRIESNNFNHLFYLDAGSNGIGINTNAPSTVFHINHPTGTTNGLSISNASDLDRWHFYTFSTNDLSLYFNNAIRGSFDDVSGTYTAVSDRNLKKDIVPMDKVLNQVMELEVVKYRFKEQRDSQKYLGFIAQDVEKVIPDLVKAPENSADESSSYMLDYAGFGTLAIKAIQEQQSIIDSQQKQINFLLKEIENIKASIKK